MGKSIYANRGMELEKLIDNANNLYRQQGVADIEKIPPPVKILKRTGKTLIGHFDKPKWVDYCGIFKQTSMLFDAKQTKGKSFPLKNIHEEQYKKLESWHNHGAKTFLIVCFSEEGRYYLLKFEQLKWAVERAENGGRKSIELDYFQDECEEIGVSFDAITKKDVLSYLKAAYKYIQEG